MARLIYKRDSTAFHLKAVRRHIRLARKIKGAEKFADLIAPFQQGLIEKNRVTTLADEKREDTYDDVISADLSLDDAVRTTYENGKQYDRSHPGEQVLLKLFPNGTFSDIISMPYAEEPMAAERIAASITLLGDTHPLFPMAEEIRNRIAGVNAALEAYKLVVTELTQAEVEEEAAKADVRKQYEFNYLDSRKELGVTYAERIFPVLGNRSKGNTTEEPAR